MSSSLSPSGSVSAPSFNTRQGSGSSESSANRGTRSSSSDAASSSQTAYSSNTPVPETVDSYSSAVSRARRAWRAGYGRHDRWQYAGEAAAAGVALGSLFTVMNTAASGFGAILKTDGSNPTYPRDFRSRVGDPAIGAAIVIGTVVGLALLVPVLDRRRRGVTFDATCFGAVVLYGLSAALGATAALGAAISHDFDDAVVQAAWIQHMLGVAILAALAVVGACGSACCC